MRMDATEICAVIVLLVFLIFLPFILAGKIAEKRRWPEERPRAQTARGRKR